VSGCPERVIDGDQDEITIVSTTGIMVERSNGIVTVTLDCPERKNAVDKPMAAALFETFAEIRQRGEDRVVVLTGSGGNFSSGADLKTPDGPTGRSKDTSLVRMRRAADAVLALNRIPLPTIAKVSGVAVGIGLSLALACDLVVTASDARLSEIFALRGLSPDGGSTWVLPRLVGLSRAKELAFFGEILSGRGRGG
jgi:2-(1,2-epoxy-1,2-dihydrophenyl)acetyl-CoA isomerase